MDKLTIGFSTPKKWNLFSATIRWGEETPYSHVYIRRKSSRVGEYVYQASGTAVNFMGIDNFLKKNKIIKEYEFEISEENMMSLIRFFIKTSGRPYSFKQILKLSWIVMQRKFGLDPKLERVDGEDAYICSELAALILVKFLGLPIEGVLDMVTPKDLFRQISRLPR